MIKRFRGRLTYANVMATTAVFIALGGSAWALSRNSVGSRQLKPNAVKASDLADDAVTSPKVANGSLLGEDFAADQLPAGPQGPPGLQGAQGDPGAPGVAGTARAFGRVHTTVCSPNCLIDHSQGVSSVTRPLNGIYCISAPGIDPATTVIVPAVDFQATTVSPKGNASVIAATGFACTDPQDFQVNTQFQPLTTVGDSANTGMTTVAGNAVYSSDVGFTFVIP